MKPIVIIASGGHAAVIAETAHAAGRAVLGFLDERPELAGTSAHGIPILGPLAGFDPDAADAVVAIGDNRIRLEVAAQWRGVFAVLVHPFSSVASDAQLGEGTVVLAGAVVQAGAVVGRHVIVNTASSVDHHGVLGDGVHICPGAHAAGAVRVGKGTILGTGASVIPGVNLGEWVMVGAGSVVTKDVPDGMKALGVPARMIRP